MKRSTTKKTPRAGRQRTSRSDSVLTVEAISFLPPRVKAIFGRHFDDVNRRLTIEDLRPVFEWAAQVMTDEQLSHLLFHVAETAYRSVLSQCKKNAKAAPLTPSLPAEARPAPILVLAAADAEEINTDFLDAVNVVTSAQAITQIVLNASERGNDEIAGINTLLCEGLGRLEQISFLMEKAKFMPESAV